MRRDPPAGAGALASTGLEPSIYNVPGYGLYASMRGAKKNTGASGMQEGMTIGRLAKAAGVHVETIRYYQRIGLIPEPQKPHGGHRRYSPAAMERINFIRHAQQLGFSLEEVKKLLSYADGRNRKEVRQIAEAKFDLLGARVEQLNEMRRKLKRLIELSKQAPATAPSPIIAALKEPE